jgi:hypothetical protein
VAGVPVTKWTLGLGLFSGFFLQAASELARNSIQIFVKAVGGRLVEFFQRGGYTLIRAISLRGQGGHTKTAGAIFSAILISSILGIFLRYVAAVAHGEQYSYNVAVAS